MEPGIRLCCKTVPSAKVEPCDKFCNKTATKMRQNAHQTRAIDVPKLVHEAAKSVQTQTVAGLLSAAGESRQEWVEHVP